MNAIILRLLQNKHTTGAAVALVLINVVAPVAKIWAPGHAQQIEETREVVEKAAMAYGFLTAGDASASLSKGEADTVFLKKSEVQPTQQKP